MSVLDRYIFKQVLFSCLAAITFFTFIMVVANALTDFLGYILAGQLPLEAAIPLIAMLVPFAFMYSLPMGILCGVLLVLGRMSAESEIVAMRAAGRSVSRISAPIYVLAVAGVAMGLVVNFYYMPVTRTAQKMELSRILHSDPLRILAPKTFVRDFGSRVIYVNEKNGPELKDCWMWELDKEQRVTRFIRAERGRIDVDEEHNELVITLRQAAVELRSTSDPENYAKPPQEGTAEVLPFRVPMESIFGKATFRRRIDWLTYAELVAEAARLSVPAADLPTKDRLKQLMDVRVVIQQRAATAVAVLSLALIAVPLGIKVSRRETSANLGLAVVLALGYYFLTAVAQWLGKDPTLRPDLFVWMPNLVFVAIGFWMNRRVGRV